MNPQWQKRLTLGLALALAVPVFAQTTTIDFEDQAVGTFITDQYEGVTFSAPPNSCGGSPPIRALIVTPNGGTSSPTRGLGVETGCPDFSPDYLRIVFDQGQGEVSFTLGDSPGTYQVRAYTTVSGGSPVSTQNITISGTGWAGVFRFVRVTRSAGDLRRVEIQDTVDDFEVIDDLTFGCPDTTVPQAEISAPVFFDDACSSVTVHGIACDPDGQYVGDRLEYLSAAAAPGTAWTLVSSATYEVCDDDYLYTWNTTDVPGGWYYLRLTVENACGLASEAVTLVYRDTTLSSLDLRMPAAGGVYGGLVRCDGSAWDEWFDEYTVRYRPAAGGEYNPVDPNHAVFTGAVLNDPLADWITNAGGAAVVDGSYRVRLDGWDDCGNTASDYAVITIDNTAPAAMLTEPLACEYVDGLVAIRGTANDANFGGWSLMYAASGDHQWVPLLSGASPVVNGTFLTWDTSGLPECAYVIRLVVTDTSILNHDSNWHNQQEFLVPLNIGPGFVERGDINCDGAVNFGDINPFVNCVVSGGCGDCP